MGTIKVFNISAAAVSTRFIVKDHPELQLFNQYAQSKDIKRLNVQQYFHGLGRNYNDYTKVIYGPVFGMEDPRNGFIYEHNSNGELIIVDENDIPVTFEKCEVIMADLSGIVKADTSLLRKGVVTDYNVMCDIGAAIPLYTTQIRDNWIPDKSFLVIDEK